CADIKKPPKPLAIDLPASWSCLVGGKEKLFGKQGLRFNTYIYDNANKLIGASDYEAIINITDPMGLPYWLNYLMGSIGGILAAIGILPVLYERYLKPKSNPLRHQNPSGGKKKK